MTTSLFYYTGSGNSLRIAQLLHKQIPNSMLLPIIGSLNNMPITVDTNAAGLIFPTHHAGIPTIIEHFINLANFNPDTYLFVVASGHKPKFSAAIHQVKRVYKRKRIQLSAGFYVPMVDASISAKHKKENHNQQAIWLNAQEKVKTIAAVINTRKKRFEKGSTIANIYSAIKKFNQKPHTKFLVKEGCIRCGYCMKVCPFNNIELKDKQPHWGDQCQKCMACFHFCSQGVIAYKAKSRGRQTYHHPQITVGDLAGQKHI